MTFVIFLFILLTLISLGLFTAAVIEKDHKLIWVTVLFLTLTSVVLSAIVTKLLSIGGVL